MESETAVVSSGFESPEFLKEMLPSAQKTALLYEISYLCLAKFPTLERIIRANAVEAQMVFSSSEALLLMCVSTSDNMVKTLFPMLKAAVKKGDAVVATQFLAKAKMWIHDIIKEVEDIVNEYKKLNNGVASATSDVILTKEQTDAKIKQMTAEKSGLQKMIDTYSQTLKEIQVKLNETTNQLNNAENEMQNLVNSISSRNSKFGIFAAVVPFIGWIVDAGQKAVNNPKDQAAIELAKTKVKKLQQEKSDMTSKEWQAQTELMNHQMQLTRTSFELGAVPDPVHLAEVQMSLTRIQQILLKLKGFWEKIGVMVTSLEQKTFASDNLVGYLNDPEYRDMFISSLEDASKAWDAFKSGCRMVMGMFSVQSKDAYKFLETSPSSLSKEEWQKQYNAVTSKLEAFYPALQSKADSEKQKAIDAPKK
ncbi:hypothetical protein UPYG_G00129720 [Umbra pygmaea]|uniref:Uncharacterized protein n=1 Tax=Umbra pygmaea TaxID=75934 RepID=A0ABD0XM04_UMBPY